MSKISITQSFGNLFIKSDAKGHPNQRAKLGPVGNVYKREKEQSDAKKVKKKKRARLESVERVEVDEREKELFDFFGDALLEQRLQEIENRENEHGQEITMTQTNYDNLKDIKEYCEEVETVKYGKGLVAKKLIPKDTCFEYRGYKYYKNYRDVKDNIHLMGLFSIVVTEIINKMKEENKDKDLVEYKTLKSKIEEKKKETDFNNGAADNYTEILQLLIEASVNDKINSNDNVIIYPNTINENDIELEHRVNDHSFILKDGNNTKDESATNLEFVVGTGEKEDSVYLRVKKDIQKGATLSVEYGDDYWMGFDNQKEYNDAYEKLKNAYNLLFKDKLQ